MVHALGSGHRGVTMIWSGQVRACIENWRISQYSEKGLVVGCHERLHAAPRRSQRVFGQRCLVLPECVIVYNLPYHAIFSLAQGSNRSLRQPTEGLVANAVMGQAAIT